MVQSGVSTSNFLEMCASSQDNRLDPCNSYILGLADGLAAGRLICPPLEGWTLIATRTVKKFLQDHPEHLGHGPGALVYMALSERYPCKEQR